MSEQLGIFSSAARAHFRRTPQRYQHEHAFRLPPSLKLGEAVRQGPFVRLGGWLAFRARSMGCKASREAAGPAPTIDFTAGPVDWGAPGEARHAWKGKFFTA